MRISHRSRRRVKKLIPYIWKSYVILKSIWDFYIRMKDQ
jgi:hypothetical protein